MWLTVDNCTGVISSVATDGKRLRNHAALPSPGDPKELSSRPFAFFQLVFKDSDVEDSTNCFMTSLEFTHIISSLSFG